MTRDHDDVKLGDIDDLNVDDAPRATPSVRSGGGGGNGGAPGDGGGPRRQAPRRTPAPKRGAGGWVFATILLAGLLAIACGYFYLQINTLQARMDNRISQSSQKLGDLQSRLSGELKDTLDQQGQTLDKHGKALKQNEDQIRKLWDVSNKRNKGWITDNQKAVKNLRGDVDRYQSTVSGLKKSIQDSNDGVKKARGDIANLRNQIDQLDSVVKETKAGSAQRKTQINQMQTQLDAAVDTLSQLRAQNNRQQAALKKLQQSQSGSAGLDKRLSNVEDAIKAFDQYRLQVNRRLDQLAK